MTAQDLMQLGPLAVVVVVLVREAIGAWKWREERRVETEAERHAEEIRALVATMREDLATARTGLASLVAMSQADKAGAEELWRRLYQQLANRVHQDTEQRAERIAAITIRAADALEAATVVIEAALDLLGDDDDAR